MYIFLGWEPIICVSESKKSQWEGIKMHTRDTIIVYYDRIVYINHTIVVVVGNSCGPASFIHLYC